MNLEGLIYWLNTEGGGSSKYEFAVFTVKGGGGYGSLVFFSNDGIMLAIDGLFAYYPSCNIVEILIREKGK